MMRPVETEDAMRDVCPSCRQIIRWTTWRAYPPPWTGAPSRGDVRNGSCECGEKRYFASRLPQELFGRAQKR
jgi:hypothetical protein